MAFIDKWMKLKTILASEINQTCKSKQSIVSLEKESEKVNQILILENLKVSLRLFISYNYALSLFIATALVQIPLFLTQFTSAASILQERIIFILLAIGSYYAADTVSLLSQPLQHWHQRCEPPLHLVLGPAWHNQGSGITMACGTRVRT